MPGYLALAMGKSNVCLHARIFITRLFFALKDLLLLDLEFGKYF